MRRLKFILLCVLGSLLTTVLGSCEAQPEAQTGGEFSALQAEKNVTGRYKLVSVEGQSVPGAISHRLAQINIHSGDFTLRADGTCTARSVISLPTGSIENRVSHCKYQLDDEVLEMHWEGAGQTTGKVSGETFTMDNHGMSFVFQHTQPVNSGETLDLATECDQAVIEAGALPADAGVFDNFEQKLVAGRNSDGMPIGYLTFQDSAITRVAISTTGKHPRRATEGADNAVLQLDLDVRDWGGVIHSFENATLTRWQPRDWRERSELRFWFYGRNRLTTLFVEILDNRKDCPNAAGAEVFTYQFTDNFSGWRQIVVPFDRFTRKEIYNNAPNDGLGLAAVHGWAFGALDSGGPTTYYLDDIEVR